MHYIYARRLESSTIGRPNLFLETIRTFSVRAGELVRFILNFSLIRFSFLRHFVSHLVQYFSSISKRNVSTIGLTDHRDSEREKEKNARLFSFRGTMKYRVSERIKRRNPSVIFPLTARGREIGVGDSLDGRKTRTGVNTGSRDLSNARKYALYVSLATLCRGSVSVGSRSRFDNGTKSERSSFFFVVSIFFTTSISS